MDNKQRINENTAKIEALAQRVEEINLDTKGVADELETQSSLLTNLESAVDKLPIPKEVPTGYAKMQEGYKEFYDSLVPTYNKKYDTTEQVTLYTPANDYNHYYIHKKANGTFRIIWVKTGVVGYQESTYLSGGSNLYINAFVYSYTDDTSTSNHLKVTTSTSTSSATYYSGEYSTVEECINAIKNKSTTYTQHGSFNMGSGLYGNTQTSVVLTNYIELGLTGLVNECGRQISSNENIVVIG